MSIDNLYQIKFRFNEEDCCLNLPEQIEQKKAYNLKMLFSRARGTLFCVTEGGLLAPVEGIKGRISYALHRADEKKKVKEVIDAALEELNDLLSQMRGEKVAQAAAKYLFDKTSQYGIGRLGKALYSHKLLKCDNTLSQYLIPTHTIRLKLSDHQFVDITHNNILDSRIISMNLGTDETLNHNCKMLLKRKKGTIYCVNEGGKLVKEKGSWKWCQDRTVRDQDVQRVVSEVIGALNAYQPQPSMIKTHGVVMRCCFSADSPLCRMSRATFDRSAIQENSRLEKILHSKLQSTRQKLQEAFQALRDVAKNDEVGKKNAKREVERALLEHTYCEFLFAQRLGLDLECIDDGGSGGARFAYDRYGRKILVIKPGDEGPSGVNNPKWYARFKRFLFSPKACLEGNSEPLAELDSWRWDRIFNIWTVPTTDVRYIDSKNFVGQRHKQCSMQMYVEDCQTLGQYVGVSKRVQWLPRPFLRWYCGSRYNSGLFYAVGQRETTKEVLKTKLPTPLIERVAVHNMGIEDIDCHFENILVKQKEVLQEKTIVERVFNGDRTVSNDDIKAYIESFFHERGNQQVLDNLLYSVTIPAQDGKKKTKVTLIKHDGGASNPRSHPQWWDILSLRYKHLFEVLPHFEGMFSPDGKALINGKEQELGAFLRAKAECSVKDIVACEVSDRFFQDESNKNLLKKWVFELNEATEGELRKQLKDQLLLATHTDLLFPKTHAAKIQKKNYEFYFDYHLKRIKSCLKARTDSFRVLQKYVNSDRHMMRAVFNNATSDSDFKNELQEF